MSKVFHDPSGYGAVAAHYVASGITNCKWAGDNENVFYTTTGNTPSSLGVMSDGSGYTWDKTITNGEIEWEQLQYNSRKHK